ncbi:MAG: MFS transporter [Firmicutes bacterium]|nr:MFS transporter [Bacillota bacterium]
MSNTYRGQEPSPSWRSHPAVYVISGVAALSLFGDALLYSVLPLYAEELGIPFMAVGLILSMNRWVRLGTNPLAAKTYQKWDLFYPLLGAMILTVISSFLYSRAWGVAVFLLARALWGLCWSHIRLGGFLVILSTSGASLGLAVGTHHAVTRLGSAFTSIIGSYFVDRGGYQRGLTIMTILSALGIFLVLHLRRILPPSDHDPRQKDIQERLSPQAPPELSPIMCYLSGFVISFVNAGMIVSSLSLVLQQRLGDLIQLGSWTFGIATISGVMLAVRWSSNLLISPLVGKLIDFGGRLKIFRFLTAAMIICLFIFASVFSPAVTVLTAVLLFFGGNSLEVVLDTAIGDTTYHGGAEKTTRISRYNSFYDLGAASGPVITYFLGSRIGFKWAFFLGAGLLLLLLLLEFLGMFPVSAQMQKTKSL